MLQKNGKIVLLWGAPICGGPVRPKMLNIPKSASGEERRGEMLLTPMEKFLATSLDHPKIYVRDRHMYMFVFVVHSSYPHGRISVVVVHGVLCNPGKDKIEFGPNLLVTPTRCQ